MSFADKMKQQEEQAREEGIATGGSGDWFKIQEGDNVFRVLTEPEMIFEKFKVGICYTDCGYEGTPKFMAFVWDRADGKIKLAKLPYSIGKAIADLENDEDYGFTGFPMPYNIKVKAKNAGTKEVEYNVIASPKREPMSQDVIDELSKKNPVSEIIEKMKEKKKEEHIADGSWQREQDRKAKLAEDLAGKRGEPTRPDYYPKEEDEVNPDDIPF